MLFDFFSIDDDGGLIIINQFSISWANAIDPYFETERLEGYTSISFGDISFEFGCIDQERPGFYITKYADGDIESITPIFRI